MNGDAKNLMEEIDRVFPLIGMPPSEEIPHHLEGCHTCEHLAADLERFRDEPIAAEAIREMHQAMSHLSAKAWRWALPHYLRYCLTPEAEYTSFETEFLIYSLSPTEEFEADTTSRLLLLNCDQIRVLREFLTYLLSTEYWGDYCPAELGRGITFLSRVLDGRTKTA